MRTQVAKRVARAHLASDDNNLALDLVHQGGLVELVAGVALARAALRPEATDVVGGQSANAPLGEGLHHELQPPRPDHSLHLRIAASDTLPHRETAALPLTRGDKPRAL